MCDFLPTGFCFLLVGHQMMELVAFGMLGLLNVFHAFTRQDQRITSQVSWEQVICLIMFVLLVGEPVSEFHFYAVRSSGTAATNLQSSSNTSHSHQILCCAYNANGTVFVTGSSDTLARVWTSIKRYALV